MYILPLYPYGSIWSWYHMVQVSPEDGLQGESPFRKWSWAGCSKTLHPFSAFAGSWGLQVPQNMGSVIFYLLPFFRPCPTFEGIACSCTQVLLTNSLSFPSAWSPHLGLARAPRPTLPQAGPPGSHHRECADPGGGGGRAARCMEGGLADLSMDAAAAEGERSRGDHLIQRAHV